MSYGQPCRRMTAVPLAGPASAYPTLRRPASICLMGPSEVCDGDTGCALPVFASAKPFMASAATAKKAALRVPLGIVISEGVDRGAGPTVRIQSPYSPRRCRRLRSLLEAGYRSGAVDQVLRGAAGRVGGVPADPLRQEDPRVVRNRPHVLQPSCVLDPDIGTEQARALIDPLGDAVVVGRDVVQGSAGRKLRVEAIQRF